MKIGLLGGTFDPIHNGHLILAQECWHILGLDKVIFIPAYISPHKEIPDNVSVADRLNLVRISLEGEKRFEISTFEIDSASTSYSINTIEHFREKYKEAEIFFIAGADSAGTLNEWNNIEKILNLVTFVVATRPGWDEKSPYEDRIKRVNIPAIDIASSDIRRRIKEKAPIDYFLKPEVVKQIRNKGLYQ
ncbi:MAG: nicotinate-nucleotide adenylyltransferase [Candidatus Aadella gelida]|nr:nicotinate-nucleotide adenylyltransferase [Candidatus Aadella gelida]